MMMALLVAACGVPSAPTFIEPIPSSVAESSVAPAISPAPSSLSEFATATAEATASPSPESTPTETATASETATAAAEPTPTDTATPTATATEAPTEEALAPFDPALAATLQRILDETVADGYIPGASLAVSIPGQEPWSGASGIAERQQPRPLAPTTNMRIASISKIFTAAVVLQLVEEGAIDLDAPMATYLPDLTPTGDRISVRNLLNHTSGLYDYLEDRNFVARAYQNPEYVWPSRELVAYANQFAPAFQPGAAGGWDYSSTNYVLLGMIVEQVTGKTLAQEMRQRIFEPLDLDRTYFAPDEQVPPTTAHGYARDVDQTNISLSFAFATANLVSTPDNVRRFIEGLVGGRLLQPATLDQMFTFVNGKGQYNMPQLEYGLGIMRNRLPVGAAVNGAARPASASVVVGHIGGFGGFRSAVWSAPEGGITIALGLNQASTDPNELATRVFDAILTYQGR
jgi:D-alanyl-D-alanine carboxypeptidase